MNNKLGFKKLLIGFLVLLFSNFFSTTVHSEVQNIIVGPPIKVEIIDAKYINNDIQVILKNT